MKIAGYQACSFCDFPGCLAAVIFTQGCNFRCPFCHNASLLPANGQLISNETVLERLQARRHQLDGVVITGGEPTLQDDLGDFLREIRRIGLRTKLDTNGSNPGRLHDLIEKHLLDFIAMDVKAPWDDYNRLAGVPVEVERLRESICLIVESGIAYEFRTTVVKPLLSDLDLDAIRSQIPPSCSHRMLPFHPEHALSPELRSQCHA